MAVAKRNPLAIEIKAYHEADVNFASTAAEATSAAATVTLPKTFKLAYGPIMVRLKPGETAMDDNALLLEPSFTQSAGVVTASLKFHNGNVAAGAAIDPGVKTFCFIQL